MTLVKVTDLETAEQVIELAKQIHEKNKYSLKDTSRIKEPALERPEEFSQSVPLVTPIEAVAKATSIVSGYPVNEIKSRSRKGELTYYRHLTSYMAYAYTNKSSFVIAKVLQRDHTSVVYSARMVKGLLLKPCLLTHRAVDLIGRAWLGTSFNVDNVSDQMKSLLPVKRHNRAHVVNAVKLLYEDNDGSDIDEAFALIIERLLKTLPLDKVVVSHAVSDLARAKRAWRKYRPSGVTEESDSSAA